MGANWFLTNFPSSRFVIEGELRHAFWRAGYSYIWFSCLRDQAPFLCQGFAGEQEFHVEWQPGDYFLLKTKEPNQELLAACERALKHRALAAYRDGEGSVVVEWRARNGAARWEELQASGSADLERLK